MIVRYAGVGGSTHVQVAASTSAQRGDMILTVSALAACNGFCGRVSNIHPHTRNVTVPEDPSHLFDPRSYARQ